MRALLLASLVTGVAVISAGSTALPARAEAPITLVQVSADAFHPTAIANAGDARIFFAEQSGAIRIIDGSGAQLATPFLDVSALISVSSEQGLLGLAFHPGYPATPYFYIDYTDTSGSVVIARYSVSTGDPNVADPNSALILKSIPHGSFANHNGGQLAFGPDAMLYAGVGDGGGGGDPSNNGQSLSTLLGKILRLDVDAAPPYISDDNPFVDTPGALGEIWAYGFRNPWRFSFDRTTGDLIIGDVGQGNWEEIDFQPAADPGGENYGWRLMEGDHCYNPSTGCDPGGLTAPILEYDHAAGDCAVIGGSRYRGSVASFAGTYVYGDFCTGRIWGATYGGSSWSPTLLLDTPYSISAFGENAVGDQYVADWGGGALYRIVPAASPSVGGVAELPSINGSRAGGSGWRTYGLSALIAAACVALFAAAISRRRS